ncbi:MAG: CBS domain-containing protein [Candidatus Krumholzibacteria bacterium]|nr:CBS domain-containing protein [Candidatus Krumholzibacteria bacterium]
MRIDEIMSKPVVTCRPGDSLDKVVEIMIEYDCGALPVIGADGHIAGIVTDRDVCLAAHNERLPLDGIRAQQAMTTKIVAARPRDSVESVEKLMADNKIRRVPVIDDRGRPVGMVSFNDIVRAAARAHEDDVRVVDTLAAICEPRRGSASALLPTSPRKGH